MMSLYKYGRQSNVRKVYVGLTESLNNESKPIVEEVKVEEKPENKIKEEKDETVMMDTNEKIELANKILSEEAQIKVKRLKKDKGLIERKENSIILTEDNRELLKD